MLALLPQMLFLGFFAPTLLRLALSAYFAYSAWRGIGQLSLPRRAFAIIEIIIAAAFFAGAWTQIAAIAAAIALVVVFVSPTYRSLPRSTIVLMFIISLTLIATGPGAIAFDLPL